MRRELPLSVSKSIEFFRKLEKEYRLRSKDTQKSINARYYYEGRADSYAACAGRLESFGTAKEAKSDHVLDRFFGKYAEPGEG